MKKSFSKSFATIIISAAIFQLPLLAQVKTNFTPEVRRSGANPTGLAPAEHSINASSISVFNGMLRNLPRIIGIAQYEHNVLQPSLILR